MKDIIVKNSKIEGKGVFANRNFKKGEIVIKYDTSVLLTKDEVDKLPQSEKKYVSYFNDGKYILHQPPARYANHSCDANTCAKEIGDIAIRDIKKGEEITADYTKEGIPDLNFKCNCGAKNCRGVICSEN